MFWMIILGGGIIAALVLLIRATPKSPAPVEEPETYASLITPDEEYVEMGPGEVAEFLKPLRDQVREISRAARPIIAARHDALDAAVLDDAAYGRGTRLLKRARRLAAEAEDALDSLVVAHADAFDEFGQVCEACRDIVVELETAIEAFERSRAQAED